MWYYILLGILQGIFEWLPISSEGIVALTSNYLIKEINPIDIALFLHIGTLFAVLIYFRKDWKQVLLLKNPPLLRFLIIATILSLVIGFPLYSIIIETAIGSSLLALMGIGLLLTSYFHKTKKTLNLTLTRLAIVAGILQGLAVMPGLSRSGSTIFSLSLGELTPSKILKLSYMMSAPVIIASSIYLVLKNPVLVEGFPALISSFIVGFLTLHFLMSFAQKINFYKFTLLFAILCFIGAIIGM